LLEIIYHDQQYIAINKPNGLLVHRTRIAEEAKTFALQMLRDQLGQRVYPLHRLDRPTSGVLLFGLHKEAAQRLMPAFESRDIEKTYLAIVRGYAPEEGTIDHPLKEEKYKEPQQAVTHFKRLATIELPVYVNRYPTSRYSLVEINPLTGRMHQIRKHFAHIRHYIVGDKKHGDWRHNHMFREELDSPYMKLHAWKLSFTQPFTGEHIHVTAPLPGHLQQICEQFGWTAAIPL
jgi:tRNA pseudouridine65 synthase